MFITKEQLKERQDAKNNLVSRIAETPSGQTRAQLDTDRFKLSGAARQVPLVPEIMKPIIAVTALMTSTREAAEQFDISASTVQNLASGQSSSVDEEKNQELRIQIYDQLADIRGKAKEKLEMALSLITQKSLEAIPAKDQARQAADIAAKMSNVIDRTIQKDRKDVGNATAIHIYTPEQRPVKTFNVVKVNDHELQSNEK